MSIVCFVNNRLGWLAVDALIQAGETIAGLVLHPESRRRYGAEIAAAAGVSANRVIDGSRLSEPAVLEQVRALDGHIGLSVLFGYKLQPAMFSLFSGGCFNLHPGLLPHGRGADPNAWAIIERAPAGVTLHWIDEHIDTGAIVAQRRVDVQPNDTGETLYRRLEDESVRLLIESWPAVAASQAARRPQPAGGSTHKRADLKEIEHIDLDRTYTGRELIDRLRALTFPPYPSAYFDDGGRRVRVRVQLTDEGEEPPR